MLRARQDVEGVAQREAVPSRRPVQQVVTGAPERVELGAGGDGSGARADEKRVWVLRDRKLVAVPVQLGIDDGNAIEVVSADLAPGDEVVIDRAGANRQGSAARKSPFAF